LRNRWETLGRSEQIASLLASVVVLGGILVGGVRLLWPGSHRSTNATQVRACERLHHQPAAEVRRETKTRWIFTSCSWPPQNGADATDTAGSSLVKR